MGRLNFSKFKYIAFLSTFLTFYPVFAETECHKLASMSSMRECDLLIPSSSLKGDIFIKTWTPEKITKKTPVILFFHGRGYAHSQNAKEPTMIEAAGLESWMQTPEFQKNPAIILSPQDLFTRKDGTGKGNDYWLGAEGRNWESFVINELKPTINNEFLTSENKWLAAGISMGAHGAMKMTLDYPDHFKAFVSLSPVFRATETELELVDTPVFLKPGQDLMHTNMGARFLNSEQTMVQLQNVKHWIEIHDKDFALGSGFKSSNQIWNTLTSHDDFNAVYPINTTNLKQPGHSMEFWRLRLPVALTWLVQQ